MYCPESELDGLYHNTAMPFTIVTETLTIVIGLPAMEASDTSFEAFFTGELETATEDSVAGLIGLSVSDDVSSLR